MSTIAKVSISPSLYFQWET